MIRDSSDEEFKAHLLEYMDVSASINYLLMINVANLRDNVNKNLILVTKDNGLTWTPSLYDLDSSWGIWWTGTELFDYSFTAEHIQDERENRHKKT